MVPEDIHVPPRVSRASATAAGAPSGSNTVISLPLPK
jgi:hypothetical protein